MTIRTKANSPEFEAAFDRIFGTERKPERGTWVQDPETGELVPKSQFNSHDPQAPAVLGSPEPFTSPIDGTLIDDRRKLREHNKRHGVTNINDYGENNGESYFKRRESERAAILASNTRQAKEERVETIKRAIARHENR